MRVAGELLTVPAKIAWPAFFGNGNTRVVWGGVFVSIVCFAGASWNLYRLARRGTHDTAAPQRAVLLIATYPFALFFSAPYSEGLFLLCSTAAVLSWLEERRGNAVCWGLLTGLARSNGWTLSIALTVDLLVCRARRRTTMSWIAAGAAAVGAGLYCIYVWRLTGHAFEWITAQEGWGRSLSPLSFLTRRVSEIARVGPLGYIRTDSVDALTFAATFFALAVAVALFLQREWLFGTWAAGYIVPAVAIDLPATGRMTCVLAPVFVWLAYRISGRKFVALLLLFAAGQVYLAAEFFRWQPPY